MFWSRNKIGANSVPAQCQNACHRYHENPPPQHRPQSPRSAQSPIFLRLKDDAKIFSSVNGTVECGVWCGVLSAMFGEIAVGQESDPPKITHQSLFAARRRFWLGKSLTLPVSRHLVLRSSFRFVLSLVPCPLPLVPSIRSDDDWWLCCLDLLFNFTLPSLN